MTSSIRLCAATIVIFFQLPSFSKANAADIKPGHPKIDFFKDPQYLKGGYNEIHSFSYKYQSGPLPELRYSKKETGIAYIICYPNDINSWKAQVKAINDRKLRFEDREKVVSENTMKIARDPSVQKQYRIYAFFFPAANVVEQDTKYRKASMPKFPCTVYVYKKSNTGWTFVKDAQVKEMRDYANMSYKVINPS